MRAAPWRGWAAASRASGYADKRDALGLQRAVVAATRMRYLVKMLLPPRTSGRLLCRRHFTSHICMYLLQCCCRAACCRVHIGLCRLKVPLQAPPRLLLSKRRCYELVHGTSHRRPQLSVPPCNARFGETHSRCYKPGGGWCGRGRPRRCVRPVCIAIHGVTPPKSGRQPHSCRAQARPPSARRPVPSLSDRV